MSLRAMLDGGRPQSTLDVPGLSPRILLMLATATLSLTLLGFLLHVTRGHPVDPALQSLRMELLATSEQLDTDLDAEVERARLVLENEPEGFGDVRGRIAAAAQSLRQTFAGEPPGTRVDSALTGYLAAERNKDQFSAAVDSQLRALVERFGSVRQQGEALASSLPSGGNSVLRNSIMSLLVAAASYCVPAAPTNGPELDALLSQLRSEAMQLAEVDKRQALLSLVEGAEALRSDKDALQRSLVAFHAAPVASTLQQLKSSYEDYSRSSEVKRDRGRLILAVYAAALFVAFAVLALRLRNTFSQLDRANGDLLRSNETLEQRIGERTRDLSRALEDLRMQQAHLVQSEKMASLGQLVAGVAHEINTPLGYARSNVQTVRESLVGQVRPDQTAPEYLTEADMLLADAEHGLERITELVLSLKDFSRIDRSRTDLYSVNDCLESALKICHNQLKERIEVHRAYSDVPPIPCAPSQLNQVFLNLINNAAQAIQGKGAITLTTRESSGYVEVSIRDSGCGMDEDVQAHIFEPFFTTKPVGQGTGLGLSIVYRIIEDHRGSIGVSSKPGEGTEFTICLPVKDAPQAAVAESAP